MANAYSGFSDRATEGYFRNMANADAREQNAYIRRRQDEQDSMARENTMINRQQQNEQVKMQRFSEAAKIAVNNPDAAMQFLAQWGEQPSPEVKEMLVAYGAAISSGSNDLPSDVRSYQFYKGLPENDRSDFLNVKRAGQKFEGGGGSQYTRLPDGRVVELISPELATGRDATRAGAMQGAKDQASIESIPVRGEAEREQEKIKRQVEARSKLPVAREAASRALAVLETLETHPGLAGGTGLDWRRSKIPGTAEFDFAQKIEQARGGAFLEAREQLKGGGPITDYEGRNAERALANLEQAQSQEAFVQALAEYRGALVRGFRLLEEQAGEPPGELRPAQPIQRGQENVGAQGATIDPELLQYMTPEEQALFQ